MNLKFKGFDDYVEIFKGGMQKAGDGSEHDGDALIENAVASFNAKNHEPPAVIGHPTDNGPAWAWVESLKEEVVDGTKTLMARFKQVVPEFADMVEKGLFKKRSAAFYPDGRLRHVGFLGAAPPAVKGLTDIGFSDTDAAGLVTFEFEESAADTPNSMVRFFVGFKEFIADKFGKDTADQVFSAADTNPMKRTPKIPAEKIPAGSTNKKGESGMEFTQEQLDEQIAQAKKDARKEVETEFAETARQNRSEAEKKQITAFCADMVKAGKIAPVWIDGGFKEFLESQVGAEVIEFSEDKKQTPLEWALDFFEHQVPKLVDFSEIADRGKDVLTGNAGEKLEALTQKRLTENRELTYSAAFAEVQTERPDLATEYQQEMTG